MIKNENFNKLIDKICTNPQYVTLRSVIEKELLHYDILFILSSTGLLNKLTFQGGTALRLCYGLKRFSEDLDFVGGLDFSASDLFELKTVIENYIGTRYGLEVTVKEPTKPKSEDRKISVDRWQVTVFTQPTQRDLPKQRIRIEVASVPAHTRKLRPIKSNYDFLPDGYTETFIHVESLNEILADKIIALGARDYLKARDIWDIQWLQQQNAQLEIDLVKLKIKDYRINNFENLLLDRKNNIENFIHGKIFMDEMSRFLDAETTQKTLTKPGFLEYLVEYIGALIQEVLILLK